MTDNQTITAISTPPGTGAIAIVRMSGKESFQIADKLFSREIKDAPGGQHYYGNFADIDDVVLLTYRAPHSFTGEDMVEICCHGSPFIQSKILQVLCENGARMALPGEFSQRAFLNGKIDLSQAEAIADLIASENELSRKVAMNHLRGDYSSKIKQLKDDLLQFLSLIELELDFSDQDVEFADRVELNKLLDKISSEIDKLLKSYALGNVLKNGINVAIVGPTNAGKSTILNALVGEERAIVSPIAGTTRDTIEDVVQINGLTFRFIDTAGLRETSDSIENIGIERSYQTIEKAKIVMLVVSATDDNIVSIIDDITKRISDDQTLLVVVNKIDLVQCKGNYFCISAKREEDIEQLKQKLRSLINTEELGDTIVTNVRHYDALLKAQNGLNTLVPALNNNTYGELLSLEIRTIIEHLSTITGEITTDDVLQNIFRNFCIGK